MKYQILRKDLRKMYKKRKVLKRLIVSFMFLLIEKKLNVFLIFLILLLWLMWLTTQYISWKKEIIFSTKS